VDLEGRPSRYRVLLVENRHFLRWATKALLDSTSNFEVVAHVERWSDALEVYLMAQPDVILLGVETGTLAGIQAAAELIDQIPAARILMLLPEADEEIISAAIRLGVRGVVCISAPLSEFIQALETVASGGSHDGGLAETGINLLGEANARSVLSLAPRELRVLRLIARGNSSKEIANALGLAVETVRHYRKSVMHKLNVHNVAGLLTIAISEGLIPQARGRAES
jgi:DNA-binding NarL/FixJ family response regulator